MRVPVRIPSPLLALLLGIALAMAAAPAAGADLDPQPLSSGPLPWLLLASERMEAGDTEGVAAALEQAHALAPDDADLTLALADAYDRARWYGAAAAAYAEGSATAPDRADVAMAQARFHLARSFRVRLALAPAERAARLLPGDPEAILLLDRARTAARLSEGD